MNCRNKNYQTSQCFPLNFQSILIVQLIAIIYHFILLTAIPTSNTNSVIKNEIPIIFQVTKSWKTLLSIMRHPISWNWGYPQLKINKWCKPVRQSSFSFSLMSSLSPSTQIPETSWGFWDSLKDLLRRFLKRIIRYKTLNVIALGQTQTDYINQIIIVTYSSHK